VNDDLEGAVDEVLGLVRSIREGRDEEARSRHALEHVLEAWHRSNAG
jgi:hypothetical protein